MDGSAESLAAAEWGAAEAGVRHAGPALFVVVAGSRLAEDEARDTVGPLAERLGATAEVARGDPAEVLVRLSQDAELVAIGSRGRGQLAATLLGSVSAEVARHARCPVVVVRTHRSSGPVVVGLDGSPHSRGALRFAFDAAARYGCELVAEQVWQDPEPTPVVPPLEHELAAWQDEARRSLSEQLAGWGESYPQVPVRQIAQRGRPVTELAVASEEARLLVVGHRGHGAVAGLVLGSVAMGVLHRASCPVAVVRES